MKGHLVALPPFSAPPWLRGRPASLPPPTQTLQFWTWEFRTSGKESLSVISVPASPPDKPPEPRAWSGVQSEMGSESCHRPTMHTVTGGPLVPLRRAWERCPRASPTCPRQPPTQDTRLHHLSGQGGGSAVPTGEVRNWGRREASSLPRPSSAWAAWPLQ